MHHEWHIVVLGKRVFRFVGWCLMDQHSSATSVIKAGQTAGKCNLQHCWCDAGIHFSRWEEDVPLQTVSLSLNLQLDLFCSTQICSGNWADMQIFLQLHLKSAVLLDTNAKHNKPLHPRKQPESHLLAWRSRASLRCLQQVRRGACSQLESGHSSGLDPLLLWNKAAEGSFGTGDLLISH